MQIFLIYKHNSNNFASAYNQYALTMTRTHVLLLLMLPILFSQCVPIERVDPSTATNSSDSTAWKQVAGFSSDQLIRALYTTPYEMYALSNSYFFRFDNTLGLQEKRLLATDKQLYGVPVFSDNTFTRVSQNTDSKQVLEFHLVRNPAVIRNVYASELIDTAKKETVNYDVLSRTTGCYSTDGTTYMITGTVYPSYTPTAFLLDVQLNYLANDFIGIKRAKRVAIPGLSTDLKIESIKYIGKNFYLATKDGGYKIGLDGTVIKLFPNWVLDFFSYKGNIYATGFSNSDFFVSSDGGDNFKRAPLGSTLRYVKNAGAQIFSQDQRGLTYAVADTSLAKTKLLKYNTTFTTSNDAYYDVVYFGGYYFISVDKSIYSNKVLPLK